MNKTEAKKMAAEYITLRAKRLEMNREARALQKSEDFLSEQVLQYMIEHQLDTFAGLGRDLADKWVLDDWEALLAWMLKNRQVPLERRLLKSAINAMHENGVMVDGIKAETKDVLFVKKKC